MKHFGSRPMRRATQGLGQHAFRRGHPGPKGRHSRRRFSHTPILSTLPSPTHTRATLGHHPSTWSLQHPPNHNPTQTQTNPHPGPAPEQRGCNIKMMQQIVTTTAEPQWIVTARSLCHVQYRDGNQGGLPRIYPNARAKVRCLGGLEGGVLGPAQQPTGMLLDRVEGLPGLW